MIVLLRFKPACSHLISDITAIGLDFALARLYGTSVEDQKVSYACTKLSVRLQKTSFFLELGTAIMWEEGIPS